MLGIRERAQRAFDRAQAATAGPWRWWTSCSYRRLSSDATGRDGDVLRGDIQRHDGQPDVVCSEADQALIAEARIDVEDFATFVLHITSPEMRKRIAEVVFRQGLQLTETSLTRSEAGQLADAVAALLAESSLCSHKIATELDCENSIPRF